MIELDRKHSMAIPRSGDDEFDDSAAANQSAVRIIAESRSMHLLPRDLAILVLVRARLAKRHGAATVLTESELRGVYRSIDDIEANNATMGFEGRFNSARGRLIEAGCIVRSDTHLLASDDPEFVITGIGEAIAEWHAAASDFSTESLMSIMEAFNAHLSVLVDRSEKTSFDDDWRHIEKQLRWVLTSMLRNVSGHQTQLDARFTHVTEMVPELLEQRDDESLDDCMQILDSIVHTIKDLYQVILQAANTAYFLLDRMETNSLASPECPATMMRHFSHIASQISSITEWTRLRQKSWTDHHAFIHRFIRTVIRVDRDRRISEALKRDLGHEPTWTLSIAAMPHAIDIKESAPVIKAQRAPRREPPMVVEIVAATSDDLRSRLQAALFEALVMGETRLSQLLRTEALAGTPLVDLARAAPWIMGRMVDSARPDLDYKTWAEVKGAAEVEELIVRKKP
jgi:chromosome partition protein MukF